MMPILVSAASQGRQFAWIADGTITKSGAIAVDGRFFGRDATCHYATVRA